MVRRPRRSQTDAASRARRQKNVVLRVGAYVALPGDEQLQMMCVRFQGGRNCGVRANAAAECPAGCEIRRLSCFGLHFVGGMASGRRLGTGRWLRATTLEQASCD